MHGNTQASVACAAKVVVVKQQANGETQLIARQIERSNAIALRQLGSEILLSGGFAEGAAHDADQSDIDIMLTAAVANTINLRFQNACHLQPMFHRHIVRRETQLGVGQPSVGHVLDVFVRYAAAGIKIAHHRHSPVKLLQKTDQHGPGRLSPAG